MERKTNPNLPFGPVNSKKGRINRSEAVYLTCGSETGQCEHWSRDRKIENRSIYGFVHCKRDIQLYYWSYRLYLILTSKLFGIQSFLLRSPSKIKTELQKDSQSQKHNYQLSNQSLGNPTSISRTGTVGRFYNYQGERINRDTERVHLMTSLLPQSLA